MWTCPECGRTFKRTNQSHYCKEAPETIDQYIAAQTEEIRPYLIQVRDAIRKAIPQAQEKISWSMPTYWKRYNLIHFAAAKNHIGLYPGEEAVEAFEQQLKEYHVSKGSIRIPYSEPLPLELIGEMARWCYQGAVGEEEPGISQDELLFFNEKPDALPLYETFRKQVQKEIENVTIKVQKTQISFSNKHMFACASLLPVRKAKDRPKRYLVVTFGLGHEIQSPRIDVATEPYPNRWTHHVLISEEKEIDEELMGWVKEAAAFASEKGRKKK